jgi:hypothetical protein
VDIRGNNSGALHMGTRISNADEMIFLHGCV